MKIFIPQQFCQDHPENHELIGYYSLSRKWLCIVDIYGRNKHSQFQNKSFSAESDVIPVFGHASTNSSSTSSIQNGKKYENFISLGFDDTGLIVVKKVTLNKTDLPENVIQSCVVVEFDMKHLTKSLYFKDKVFHNDIVEFLSASCSHVPCSYLPPSHQINSENKSILLCLCAFVTMVTSCVSRLGFLRVSIFHQFCSPPAVLEQLKRKHQDCAILSQQLLSEPHGSCQLRVKNMVLRNIVDTALGLVLLWLFISTPETIVTVSNSLADLGQKTAQEMQVLLNWMMGVPAGLKLNSQLDQFLGKFFLYHIYLWKAYLNVLRPVLPSLLWYTSLSGCLGLSVQLALLQDLLSMMTLHIYCFYVYAARLYNFQMSGLSSLWRLFRGKKWNSLRQRVDTAEYDVNQLFVGTLLFTVLLFLLPTTALYYVIFLGLRLLVLVIQGSLFTVISVLNDSPLYLLILRLVSCHTLADTLEFVAAKNKCRMPLHIEMKFKATSYSQVIQDGQMAGVTRKPVGWGKLLTNILTGRLIYPWIDKVKTADRS